ncbi:Hypothetical protein CINCED_3A021376 [Cinara cedri]|nr:Hypothetical protein CINCED_3A021376 [Cinara cedri]
MCLELDGVVNGTCHNPGYTSKAVCCTVKSEREYKGIGINDDLNKILAFKYVNPNFPGGLNETSKHHFRFKKVSKNVTQLRLDFVTFNLALPNETTKICTEDVMIISHGSSKQLKICGSYSDKHIYYNLDDEKEDLIFINITLLKKNFYRDWEIKVTQLMEHQKVPDTCLQFFEEVTGKVQMTNITLNGRDLNNGKNNRICILHKPHMCSITYQPCIKHVIKPQPDSFLNGKTIQFGLNLWEEIVDDNTGFCQDYQQKICRYRP